ncbi:MAG: glycosyltransferase family 2 protein [Akkermansiaceae bacterium]|nr:glycosyltransferase family 2 protein [Akkermansiaceae bacterium]
MAYLEVITRTFGGRPELLARCTASLEALEDRDWVQRIVVDDERRGVAWAVGNLATIEAAGSWVWVLDDDDLCTFPGLIGAIRELEEAEAPDVIAVRVDHGEFGILPPDKRWRRAPARSWVSTPNVIVRRDVWERCRHGWTARYSGDFDFVSTLWWSGARWAWLDVVAAGQPVAMHGAAEERAGAC